MTIPPEPYRCPRPATARSTGGQAADVTVAVVTMVAYCALLVMGSGLSLFLGLLSDGCNEPGDCNDGLIGVGMVMAMVGIWVPFLGALIGMAVQGARGRTIWWVPLAAAVVSAGVFILGVGLAATGGPQS